MIPLIPALETLRDLRRDEVVVTTMGAAREWPKLSSHPLDFHFIPSAMGHSTMLGLGLALAQPQRQVLAFSGDGGMLMGLGSLVTIAAAGAKNLTVIVLENGVYEVTGGQRTAAHEVRVDLTAVARGCGIASVARFEDLTAWRAGAAAALAAPGPRFIVLAVERVAQYELNPPGPIRERLAKFRAALAS